MSGNRELIMSFDPNTIEHLGVKMYSRVPIAIAELIANSYDANGKNVVIHLHDDGTNKSISVEDDGDGMTFDEVNSNFLRIGRNRRDEGEVENRLGRKVTGKKGLGKLALFGIGDTIEVVTKKDGLKVHFRMDWNALKEAKDANYKPDVIAAGKTTDGTGTTIILSNLKRKSPFNEHDLAVSISKLFNFFDANFRVKIINEDREIEVTKELRYSSIVSQFEFGLPEILDKITDDYPHKGEIKGCVLTTKKPLKPGLRGITLFANGRLVNAPEFFGRSESSHFYSYTTGWIEVDFVDTWELDVISTNRQSLDWDFDETERLREFLKIIIHAIQKKWREQRKIATTKDITTETNINIEMWYDKLPEDIQPRVEKIVNNVVKKELTADDQKSTVEELNKLIPAYPYYHWRHLHASVQGAADTDYQNGDYYRAFLEAAKKYINSVRSKSGSTNGSDATMMMEVFGREKVLAVTKNFIRPNGDDFNTATKNDIEDGNAFLSRGTVSGGRNPLSHEEIKDLRESGLFTEKDCLDLLSLVSHLYKRLDDAELRSS